MSAKKRREANRQRRQARNAAQDEKFATFWDLVRKTAWALGTLKNATDAQVEEVTGVPRPAAHLMDQAAAAARDSHMLAAEIGDRFPEDEQSAGLATSQSDGLALVLMARVTSTGLLCPHWTAAAGRINAIFPLAANRLGCVDHCAQWVMSGQLDLTGCDFCGCTPPDNQFHRIGLPHIGVTIVGDICPRCNEKTTAIIEGVREKFLGGVEEMLS